MYKLSTDTQKLYKKRIFKPLNEQRNIDLGEINKKATYKEIKVNERKPMDDLNVHQFENDKVEGHKKL